MRLALIASLVAGMTFATAARAAGTGAPSGFTTAQRAEIVQIVRQALQRDPSILRDAIESLRADEQNQQAHAAQAAIADHRAALFSDPADPVAGNPAGNVTVVEFYDPRCPYCRRMVPEIDSLLASDPQIRLVYKDLPILGDQSVLASRVLLAAHLQGGYVRLQHALMAHRMEMTPETLRKAAIAQGLNWARIEQDMKRPEIDAKIRSDLALAHALGIDGTPAFIIGDTLLPGAVSLADLRTVIAAARGQTAAAR